MSTGQSAVMLCGWGVKAGWLLPLVDARVGGKAKLSDTSLTHVIPERFKDGYNKIKIKCSLSNAYTQPAA